MSRAYSDPAQKTWDDFQVGDVMTTRGRTVDMGDLTVFAGLTGDHYPLHTDEVYCSNTQFGTRITHGPLTFAFAVGLVGASGFYGDAIVALVEIQSLRALKPVIPGDTLHVHAEVVQMDPGHKPHYGTLHVQYSVRNQKEEEVMQFRQIMRARREGAQHGG